MQRVGDSTRLSQLQNLVLKGFDPVSRSGFIQIPRHVLQNLSLTDAAKIVYSMLLAYAWNNDFCYPGQERLAQDIGKKRRSVIRAIQDLEKAGLLDVRRRGQGKTNIYTLHATVEKGKNNRS